ncbi:bifunctional heptose 7-phosphate kinase/heptose 1-phosphate adenyltransferase [Halobacteriota archaeon]
MQHTITYLNTPKLCRKRGERIELSDIVDKFNNKKILVIGDVMVDKFIIGDVTRISPEAPVPVVDISSESLVIGGAANAVNNLHALGGEICVASVVGDDHEGDYLVNELKNRGIATDGIFRTEEPTTLVTRIRTFEQQILRLDRADKAQIGSKTTIMLIDYIKELIDDVDVIVISDYGRGVITPKLVDTAVEITMKYGKKIVVDPKKENFLLYKGVTVIRANRKEASYATGVTPINETSIRNMGQRIMTMLECKGVLITWVEEGFYVFEQNESVSFIPPVVKNPLDVTGVGDTITSVLALGLTTGATLVEAAKLSNYAAGLTANKKGLALLSTQELKEAISREENESKGRRY